MLEPLKGVPIVVNSRFATEVVPEIPVMWRAAYALCGNPHDAEDLVQDSLVKAFRFLDGFDGAHPRAWLLTIVRNTHRSNGRRRRPTLFANGEVPDSSVAECATPASAESEATARLLDGPTEVAVRSLSSKLAQVVALVDMGGFTYDEAAAALGIPVGTVMSRLHRARSQIRAHLERQRNHGGTSR